MNRPASIGQHLRAGSVSRSTSSPVITTSWHGARETVLGLRPRDADHVAERLQLADEPRGRPLHEAEDFTNALRQIVEVVDAEGERHAAAGAEQVDGDGDVGALDVLEQQRGAAGLDGAVGDLGDLQVAADRDGDAAQFALVPPGRK